MQEPKVAVFGLGKLGTVYAALLAARGFHVIGCDTSKERVEQANRGAPLGFEPNLPELLAQNSHRFRATTDAASAIDKARFCLLVVPTPSDNSGEFSNRFLLQAIRDIGAALTESTDPFTLVVVSTVSPGSCEAALIPELESSSGRRLGGDLGFVYSPLFVALGSAVKDLEHPDLLLVGSQQKDHAQAYVELVQNIFVNEPAVAHMSLPSAEVAKLAVNSFVTAKISFANMLGELCGALPGADVDAVTGALGADRRIGSLYMSSALGFGGPCFPRDNVALSAVARRLGTTADLAEATQRVNLRQVERFQRIVLTSCNPGAPVSILGLAYKQGTPVIEESQAYQLAVLLTAAGHRVLAHDPLVQRFGRPESLRNITMVDSVDELLDGDVLILADPSMGNQAAHLVGEFSAVFDLWNVLAPAENVVRPGRSVS